MARTPQPAARLRLGVARALLLASVVLGMLGVEYQGSAAQSPSAVPLDLAAMTLVPSDVPVPGFALAGARQAPLGDEAARLARDRGAWHAETEAAIRDDLANAGWHARYESRLVLADGDEPGRVGATVVSDVTEYADAAGAAAGFGLVVREDAAGAARPRRGLIPLGEESRLVRTFVPGAEPERPAVRLTMTFRVGNLVAAVAATDLTAELDWGVTAVEGLAASLLVRVEAVRGGGAPGLGPRLLRFDDADLPPPAADLYDRLGGETFPLYGVDPEDAADRERLFGAATDVYSYEQALPTGATLGVPPSYVAKLYRFPDVASAAGWLEGAPALLFDDPGSFLDLAEVEEAATIGEASRTVAFAFPASDAVTTSGYRVYARVGNEVARVQIDAEPGVALATVEAFARVQVACLGRATCEEPPPVDRDRLILATPPGP